MWKTRYAEASFRSIKFFVRRSPSEYGRNKIVHEIAFSEKPIVEDTGKLTQRFPIDGFLIGDDYDLTRDQIIKAVEKTGPGQLIHPYHGIKTVECLNCKIDESFLEGNFARISFEFIEAGSLDGILGFVDEALKLIDDANDFIDNLILEFNEVFSVLSAPAFVVQSAAGLVDKVGDFILSKNGLGAVQASVSDLSNAITELKIESQSLVRSPRILAERTIAAFEALGDSFSAREDGINAVTSISDLRFSFTPSLYNTTNRRRERNNRIAFENFSRSVSLGVSAKILSSFLRSQSSGANRLSSGEVIALRNSIVTAIEGILFSSNLSLDTYRSLLALKTKLLESIPGAIELPETRRFILDKSMSIYQLSYRLYGSIREVDEIMERNPQISPSLIPQGTEVEYAI